MHPGSLATRTIMRLLGMLGMVWTFPNTLIGLLAGLIACIAGGRMQVSGRDLAVVVTRFPWGPGGAITFGNVILATGKDLEQRCPTYACRAGLKQEPWMRLGDHERAHVLQYMVLGPLFLPLYLLCGGVSVRNRFEQAADRYALTGSGWWPW